MERKAKIKVTRVEIAVVEIDDNGDVVGVNETLDHIEEIEAVLIEFLP
jgi:hypothetical protein